VADYIVSFLFHFLVIHFLLSIPVETILIREMLLSNSNPWLVSIRGENENANAVISNIYIRIM
jgi:hypothetical protein